MSDLEKPDCPFCAMDPSRIVASSGHHIVIRDGFPVSPGHTLIIPRRHVRSFFALTTEERVDLLTLLDEARAELDAEFSPDGYNIGVNDGAAAGQTVMHLHVHLIPRFEGDVEEPRGGVRWMFPEKAEYWGEG